MSHHIRMENSILSEEEKEAFIDLLTGNISDISGEPILKYRDIILHLKDSVFDAEPFNRSVIIDVDDLFELNNYVHDRYPSLIDFNIVELMRKKPTEMIKELNEYLYTAIDRLYGSAGEISKHGPFYVRIRLPPTDAEGMEMISGKNTERLILVKGIVTKTSENRPLLIDGRYVCKTCGAKYTYRQPYYTKTVPPPLCTNTDTCSSAQNERPSLVLIESESVFVGSQWIEIQEEPNHLKKRHVPRAIRVMIIDDGVYSVSGGDLVSITGILKVVPDVNLYRESLKSPTFDQFILASSVEIKKKNIFGIRNTYTEKDFLEKVSTKEKQEQWWNQMIEMIANGIEGYRYVKEGLCCQLFSGQERFSEAGDVRRRGFINILIAGEPGTGKTSIANSLKKIVPKAIFTNAKQSSEAGLTAGITFDEHHKPVLNAGALVKADGGFAIIDELDKAKKENLHALLEALEDNRVTVAKISTLNTLNTRCDVLCLANPINGKYRFDKEFIENFPTIPVPLLSRFDLIFLLVEFDPRVDVEEQEKRDEAIACKILEIDETDIDPSAKPKRKYVPTEDDYEFLSEYIRYAKKRAEEHPITLSREAKLYLLNFYKQRRKRAFIAIKEGEINPDKDIDARYLEAMIRLTTARAKALLKSEADIDDAKVATNLLIESLRQISPTGEVDLSIMTTGKSSASENNLQLVLQFIADLQKRDEYKHGIKMVDFENELMNKGIIKMYKDANKRIKMSDKQAFNKIMNDIIPYVTSRSDGSILLNESGKRKIRKINYSAPSDDVYKDYFD